jgi:hypothetical protein
MAEFVLYPAKLRDGKFMPIREEEPVVLDWKELAKRLAPSKSRQGLMLLRSLRPGVFVGTRKRGAQPLTFLFDAAGKSRNIGGILKGDPMFEESLVEVFLVDQVKWDSRFVEKQSFAEGAA